MASQPSAFAHHLRESHFEIEAVERFGTTDFDDVLASFLLHDARNVGARHNAQHASVLIEHRHSEQPFLSQEVVRRFPGRRLPERKRNRCA